MQRIDRMRAGMAALRGTSPWVTLDQGRIDAFAEVTDDRQFIHIDPHRAAQTPLGGTVAHGFLTLAMLSHLLAEARLPLPPLRQSLNYGFDSLRFVTPVRAGARVRGVFAVTAVEPRGEGRALLHVDTTVEIEGHHRPALVADWLALLVLD